MRRRSIMMSRSLRTLDGDGAAGSSSRISSIVARRRRWRISMIWLSRRVSAGGLAGMADFQRLSEFFRYRRIYSLSPADVKRPAAAVVDRGVREVAPTPAVAGVTRRVSLHLRGNRHLEAARLRDFEGAGLPLSVVRLGVELHARRLRARRDLIDVLLRTDEEAHPDPFLAVASLLPVVLAQADAGIARAQHDAKQLAVFFPLVFHHESQAFEESDALLKVVDREAWRDRLCLQGGLGRCCHRDLRVIGRDLLPYTRCRPQPVLPGPRRPLDSDAASRHRIGIANLCLGTLDCRPEP